MLSKRSLAIASLVLALAPLSVMAQPPRPAPPKEYDVQLRYRIRAARNERVLQFFPFVKYLESVGFKKDPGPHNEPEDLGLDRMTGTIASDRVRDLLQDSHVKSLLLFPSGYKLPADPRAPVKVQIEIGGGRGLPEQRLFYEQVREQLQKLGYKERFLFDHRNYTRLVGFVPAEEVNTLFRDLRGQPDGWFTPLEPIAELPVPLRFVSPILIAEVIPEPDGMAAPKEAGEPLGAPKGQEKIAPEVRRLLGQEADAAKPLRMQVMLVQTPTPDDTTWSKAMKAVVPELIIEGRMGQYVAVVAPPTKMPILAALEEVATIRLPPSGTLLVLPHGDAAGADREAINASGLTRLHALGQRGKGVRVVVISGDFRGYEALRGKQLPKNTRLIDLTAERNPELEPEKYADDGLKEGHGTHCAVAAALAAPEADLTLVRIDPAAIHQLYLVARAVYGDAVNSESLDRRTVDLDNEKKRIDQLWRLVIIERNILFNQFDEDPAAIKKREEHFQKVKELKEDEAIYGKRMERYLQLQRDLRELRRTQVVVSTLGWHDGYPVDGSSPLPRYFNNSPPGGPLWFQPAGATREQTWTGLFRDFDNNGAMEFAPARAALRPARWTAEANFLAWQPFKGDRDLALPEKATIRVSAHWREAHDPEFLKRGEDLYQEPLAKVRLILLRQRDPSGQQVGADEMEIVARSAGPALRISNQGDAATYEVALDFTVETAGHYALRIEGLPPDGTRPASVPTVPAIKRSGEFRLRLLLDVLDAASRAAGRPVFLDYGTDEGAIAMPGDAQRVFTVGAANRAGRPEPSSANGPAMNLELLLKPNFLAFDGLEVAADAPKGVYGTSISASFAGGLAASSLSGGIHPEALGRTWFAPADTVLKVPARR